MHHLELDPKHIYYPRQRTRVGYVRAAIAAAAIGAGALVYFKGWPIFKEIIHKAKQPEVHNTPPGNHVNARVPVTIDKDCRPFIEDLIHRDVKKQDICTILKTIQIESDFNHNALGSNGDAGYSQQTKVCIEDRLERAMTSPKTKAAHLVRMNLGEFSRRDMSHYIGQRGIRRSLSRRKIVNGTYSNIRKIKKTDFYMSSGTILYGISDVSGLCRQYHVHYSEELAEKYHNAPGKIKAALRDHGANWRADGRIPDITMSRDIRRYYVPDSVFKHKSKSLNKR